MTNAIELTGLVKRYGRTTAVDHLDLSVPAGQVLALLGPNGAGKTTTTDMVLGLVRPDAGVVRVFGEAPEVALRHGRVGAMLQGGSLWEGMSVGGMLRSMHGLYAHPLPLADVIARSGVEPFLRTMVEKLSGGQRQRARFALALMGDPQLILLDEPTAGLDVDARRQFWATMHDFAAQGRTVLFATHYLDEADEFADRTVVMARGRIVADGTPDEVKHVVAGRRVSFVAASEHDWAALPTVTDVTRDDRRVTLACADSDAVLRAVVGLDVSDITVATPSLEDAFLRLVEQPDADEPDATAA